MRNNKIMMIAGIASAGVLAIAGFVGVQGLGLTSTVNVYEYKLEKNDGRGSGLSDSGDAGEIGTVTKYKSLEEIVDSLDEGWGYKYVNVNGYNGKVLAVAPSDEAYPDRGGVVYPNGKQTTSYVTLYTKNSNGKVICAGSLKTNSNGKFFSMDDKGTIYVSSPHTYETYFLSSDGSELLHKDFIQVETVNGKDVYWGYTKNKNTDKPAERDFTEKEFYEYVDRGRDAAKTVEIIVK